MMYPFIAKERSPNAIIKFVLDHKNKLIKHCDVKAVRFALEGKNVLTTGKRQQLETSQSVADANDLFCQFLCNDPAPETLLAAARVLKEASGTTNMNKTFAKAIEDFFC